MSETTVNTQLPVCTDPSDRLTQQLHWGPEWVYKIVVAQCHEKAEWNTLIWFLCKKLTFASEANPGPSEAIKCFANDGNQVRILIEILFPNLFQERFAPWEDLMIKAGRFAVFCIHRTSWKAFLTVVVLWFYFFGSLGAMLSWNHVKLKMTPIVFWRVSS